VGRQKGAEGQSNVKKKGAGISKCCVGKRGGGGTREGKTSKTTVPDKRLVGGGSNEARSASQQKNLWLAGCHFDDSRV